MCLLRRAFAREAYSHTDKLRTLSDNTLRRRLNFPTLESAKRERRLKWYHVQVNILFFGFAEIEEGEGGEGREGEEGWVEWGGGGAQTVVAAVEQAANHYQSQNPGKGKPHPMGPRRVTLAAGLPNALSVINLAKADQQQQAIIERQDKLLAIVNKPSIAKQKDMLGQLLKMYTTPDQLLPEIAACVWSGISFTQRSCAHERNCKSDLHPEDHWREHCGVFSQGHAALEVAAVHAWICFNPDRRRLTQHCHLQRPSFYTFFSHTETT